MNFQGKNIDKICTLKYPIKEKTNCNFTYMIARTYADVVFSKFQLLQMLFNFLQVDKKTTLL